MGKYNYTKDELMRICKENNQDLSDTAIRILVVILEEMSEAYEEGYQAGLKARESKNEL